MSVLLGQLASGESVYDRHNSHVHTEVQQLIAEALAKVNSEDKPFLKEKVDFKRIIGSTICVPTAKNDHIVYAKRPNRLGYTRFVKGRAPDPCSSVILVLKKADVLEGYILITAFIGEAAEPEPWDRNATNNSQSYWDSHALVWGYEEVIPGTELSNCPW